MRKIASSSAKLMERIEGEKMKIECYNDLIILLLKGPLLFANIAQSIDHSNEVNVK